MDKKRLAVAIAQHSGWTEYQIREAIRIAMSGQRVLIMTANKATAKRIETLVRQIRPSILGSGLEVKYKS